MYWALRLTSWIAKLFGLVFGLAALVLVASSITGVQSLEATKASGVYVYSDAYTPMIGMVCAGLISALACIGCFARAQRIELMIRMEKNTRPRSYKVYATPRSQPQRSKTTLPQAQGFASDDNRRFMSPAQRARMQTPGQRRIETSVPMLPGRDVDMRETPLPAQRTYRVLPGRGNPPRPITPELYDDPPPLP